MVFNPMCLGPFSRSKNVIGSSSSSDDEVDCPSFSLLPSSDDDDDDDESYRVKREVSFLDLDLNFRLEPDDFFDVALEVFLIFL